MTGRGMRECAAGQDHVAAPSHAPSQPGGAPATAEGKHSGGSNFETIEISYLQVRRRVYTWNRGVKFSQM